MTDFTERQIMFSIEEFDEDGWIIDFCVCEEGSVIFEKSMPFYTVGSFAAASHVLHLWLTDMAYVGPHYSWADLGDRVTPPRMLPPPRKREPIEI